MPIAIAIPVAGLPAGPATEVTVKGNVSIDMDDHRDDVKLELNINAANDFVAGLPVTKNLNVDPDDPEHITAWPPKLVLGATLLASRWFRRSNSPAGVIDLGGEAGVAYVQRNDPDIGLMLGIGPYTRPAVG